MQLRANLEVNLHGLTINQDKPYIQIVPFIYSEDTSPRTISLCRLRMVKTILH